MRYINLRLLTYFTYLLIEWYHFQWLSRTLNPVFKITAFLQSNISKTQSNISVYTDKFTIGH